MALLALSYLPIGGRGQCPGDMATAPSGPTARSGLTAPSPCSERSNRHFWVDLAWMGRFRVQNWTQDVQIYLWNVSESNFERFTWNLHTFFSILEKSESAQIAPPWRVEFFATRSQHTEPIQPSGGFEEIEL